MASALMERNIWRHAHKEFVAWRDMKRRWPSTSQTERSGTDSPPQHTERTRGFADLCLQNSVRRHRFCCLSRSLWYLGYGCSRKWIQPLWYICFVNGSDCFEGVVMKNSSFYSLSGLWVEKISKNKFYLRRVLCNNIFF